MRLGKRERTLLREHLGERVSNRAPLIEFLSALGPEGCRDLGLPRALWAHVGYHSGAHKGVDKKEVESQRRERAFREASRVDKSDSTFSTLRAQINARPACKIRVGLAEREGLIK